MMLLQDFSHRRSFRLTNRLIRSMQQAAQSHWDIFRQCDGWKIGRTNNKSFSEHRTNLTKNISVEILSKELEPIALQKNQFENWHTNNINWNLFACSAHQQSSLRDTVRKCFIWESFKEMSLSIRTLIDEIKNVVFAKVEVEYQDNSTLIKILPHLVKQDSKSNIKDRFYNFREETVFFK